MNDRLSAASSDALLLATLARVCGQYAPVCEVNGATCWALERPLVRRSSAAAAGEHTHKAIRIEAARRDEKKQLFLFRVGSGTGAMWIVGDTVACVSARNQLSSVGGAAEPDATDAAERVPVMTPQLAARRDVINALAGMLRIQITTVTYISCEPFFPII